MTDKKTAGNFAAFKESWLKLVTRYPVTARDLAVAIHLSGYLNVKTRDAWPSMATLAADIGCEKSTVLRSLQRLEKFKLLAVTHSRSRHKPNRYRPRLGPLDASEIPRRRSTPRGIAKVKRMRRDTLEDAGPQRRGCGAAYRTSEEPLMKSRNRESERKTDSLGSQALR
jgi:Helix-turn-helix domain